MNCCELRVKRNDNIGTACEANPFWKCAYKGEKAGSNWSRTWPKGNFLFLFFRKRET